MKQAALFILFSLAAFCFASCTRLDLVSRTFANGVKQFRVPPLQRKIRYGSFFEDFSRNVENLINEVIVELYRQARYQSNILGNTLASIEDQLQSEISNNNNSCNNSSATYNEYSDALLEKLNRCLAFYFELNPESPIMPQKNLPEIEDQWHINFYYITQHTLKDLFLNLETMVDTHLANIHVVIMNSYSAGWNAARTGLRELQQKFREDFINDYLSDMFTNTVNSLCNNNDKIKGVVRPDTWKQYEEYALRIKNLHKK